MHPKTEHYCTSGTKTILLPCSYSQAVKAKTCVRCANVAHALKYQYVTIGDRLSLSKWFGGVYTNNMLLFHHVEVDTVATNENGPTVKELDTQSVEPEQTLRELNINQNQVGWQCDD